MGHRHKSWAHFRIVWCLACIENPKEQWLTTGTNLSLHSCGAGVTIRQCGRRPSRSHARLSALPVVLFPCDALALLVLLVRDALALLRRHHAVGLSFLFHALDLGLAFLET